MSNYLKLNCNECENSNCDICPLGTYIPHTSKRGCIRQVSEQDYIQYNHYMNEVLPFLHTYKYSTATTYYTNIITFLNKIYQLPVTNKIKHDGTVKLF